MGRTNMRYPYTEAGGLRQPQRAAGQTLPFTTEKTPGLGSNPGFQIVRRPCYHGATARPFPAGIYHFRSRRCFLENLFLFMYHALVSSSLHVEIIHFAIIRDLTSPTVLSRTVQTV